jgi:mono/diheme cytochrome c family protein
MPCVAARPGRGRILKEFRAGGNEGGNDSCDGAGRMRPFTLAAALGLALSACSVPPPEPATSASADAQRGQLLYEAACVECHSTQAHWRDKRLVRDWPGLVHQVTRWQAIAGQNWRREEVADVAEYLNQRFYKLP